MKLGQQTESQGGYALIEYLVYIAVLAVVMGVAFNAFYRCLDTSRDLVRSTEDILRVLNVGEVWRADIRKAVASPRVARDGPVSACEIPHASGLVVYIAVEGSVWRKQGDAPPRQVLTRVKTSSILTDPRRKVAPWRWEIELTTRRKGVRLRPLFTFEAVPARPL
jgi:hypothetical protein